MKELLFFEMESVSVVPLIFRVMLCDVRGQKIEGKK
jgi:hypothetical protein